MMRSRLLLLGAFAASIAVAPRALANGRFPSANQLVVHPRDPSTLLVRSTFGILYSREGGRNSRVICDQIIGAASVVDPGVGFFDDGSILVAAPVGLAVSSDHGCSFPVVQGELANQRFIDVTSDRTDPRRALALSATQKLDGTEDVRVFESTDDGRSWSLVSAGLDPNALVTTLDIAPSNPQRVYLSGNRVVGAALEGFVARSDDRGRTFTYARCDFADATQIYIAGVDPFDADLLYLRTYKSDAGPSHLVVSRDGGKTFAIATTISSNMSGFALSPDGARVAIAGLQTGVAVAARPAPLEAGATDGGTSMTFETHSPLPMRCLGWEGNRLYGCGSGVPVGCGAGDGQFLFGESTDEGRTWTPLIPLLSDLLEPDPACGAATPSKVICTPAFPEQHQQFLCPYAVASDAGADAGIPVDAGPTPPPALDDCGCGVVGGARSPLLAYGVGGAALVAGGLVARRRRRSRPTDSDL